MQNEKPSFVFFGSGPVAAENLRLLVDAFTIEAIITKPATKETMQRISPGSPLFTVSNKSELDTVLSEQKFSSKIGLLIDFGILVSQRVIDYFPLGIVNSHFSLLPELRGADPISFAILEGKQSTGVSLMLLVEAMDEGPLLTSQKLVLDGKETATILTNKLVTLSASLLVECLPKYIRNEVFPTPQKGTPTYTRKLTKQDGVIDWSKPAGQIEREIRAYVEWPKSHTSFNNLDVVIGSAHVIKDQGSPGVHMMVDNKLIVYCGKDALSIETLKPAGKATMDIRSFINGYGTRI